MDRKRIIEKLKPYASILAVVVVASCAGGSLRKFQASVYAEEKTVLDEVSSYEDGTYYGTGTGFGGILKVKVVISSGKIASIDIVETRDGTRFIRRASEVISQILSTQNTNVDTVSGATYSSNAIIEACRVALESAKY